MRLRTLAAVSILVLTGCGPKRVTPSSTVPVLQPRLSAADALIHVGCFDCLTEAAREYQAIRAAPGAPAAIVARATTGAARAAILLDLRERELGMLDEGHLERARALTAGADGRVEAPTPVFEFVDTVSWRISEAQAVSDDVMLDRARRLGMNRDAWKVRFRDHAGDSEFDAYLWLAFGCASGEALKMPAEELLAPIAGSRDAPILVYKHATCPAIDAKTLATLLAQEPRFVEANYFLGVQSILLGRLDEAEERLRRAYEWHRRWPAVTLSLANVAMTAEEFDRALALYDETLDAAPAQRDAMIGRVKSLTYLGRHEDAMAGADRLLEGRWNRGEAYYWRSWNGMQLDRLDRAWADVEDAWTLWMNSDVAKLAGMIAYRRHELDVARQKFETGHTMNANDCEMGFYLGLVYADLRNWASTAETLTSVAVCADHARQRLAEEIAQIEASTTLSAERKARQVAKREQQRRAAGRMIATSWFNTAVAYFNLQRKVEARQFAEKVSDDEEFGVRARDLLARVSR